MEKRIGDMEQFLQGKGIKAKERRLILEAYRRYMMFAKGKPLQHAWLGLGTPSNYKSDLFQPAFRETPRVLNWYKLSSEGVTLFDSLLKRFPIPKRIKSKDRLNTLLFG